MEKKTYALINGNGEAIAVYDHLDDARLAFPSLLDLARWMQSEDRTHSLKDSHEEERRLVNNYENIVLCCENKSLGVSGLVDFDGEFKQLGDDKTEFGDDYEAVEEAKDLFLETCATPDEWDFWTEDLADNHNEPYKKISLTWEQARGLILLARPGQNFPWDAVEDFAGQAVVIEHYDGEKEVIPYPVDFKELLCLIAGAEDGDAIWLGGNKVFEKEDY